jgi:hypothetical protein
MQGGKREPPDRAGLSGRLSIQNRVFLALLWVLADRFGVVRNTGLSGLGEMAGSMTRDQVCSQLAKLERLGYVKSRVGGISSSRIFGRSEGAILLNSIHPALYQPDGAREMQWMDFMGLGEGALVRVWEAFDQADKIQRRIESIEATRDRLKSGEGVIPESQRGKIDTLILELRQQIRTFEHENQLPSSEHDFTHLVGSSVDSNIVPGHVTYAFELFSDTSLSARRFTLLVVCLYANELLHRNPGKHLSGGLVDYEMLDDINNALSDRVFGNNPNLRRCIAGWIYDLARDLAGDVLRWRSHTLGHGEDHILTKCTYTLFPSRDSKSILSIKVFLDEPGKSWIKGW